MPHSANISGREAARAFTRAGYVIQRQTASHIILHKPGSPILSIPDHREVAPNLLRSQVRLAGLSIDEFLRLLAG